MGYRVPPQIMGNPLAVPANSLPTVTSRYSSYAPSTIPQVYPSTTHTPYAAATPFGASTSPAVSQLSISSIPTQKCRYCGKGHIPQADRMVTDPITKLQHPTCSSECHKGLLRSMVANLHRQPAAAPSGVSYSAPPSTVPSVPLTFPTNGAYTPPTSMVMPAMGYAPTTTTPSLPAYAPPIPSLPMQALPAQNTRWTATPPIFGSSVTAPAYTTTQAYGQTFPSLGSKPMPYAPFQASAPTQPYASTSTTPSYSGDAKKDKSKDKSKRDKKSASVSSSTSSSDHGRYLQLQKPQQTIRLATNSLDLQLQKWVDQRANLPAFWHVTTVILDTNVLLDQKSPDVMFDLHRLSPDILFIVPFVLLQELDALKARASGPQLAARGAITRLHEFIVQGQKKDSKWIRGQKPTERIPFEGGLLTTSGDDRILECVNYFHRYSPKGRKAMLLSHDKNLQLKATSLGMLAGTVSELRTFFEGFQWLKKEREILKTQLTSAELNGQPKRDPDFRLEDYEPTAEEEEDEFMKVKRAEDLANKIAADEAELARKKAEDAKKLEELQADARARLPEGTRIDLYDSSTSTSPVTSPREITPPIAVSITTSTVSPTEPSTTPASMDESVSDSKPEKRRKKDKKDKKAKKDKKEREKKNKKKRERTEAKEEDVEQTEPVPKKQRGPDVVVIDSD